MTNLLESGSNGISSALWSDDERACLKRHGVDPARHSRDKLTKLVSHIVAGGSNFQVTHLGNPVNASAGFVRKVRKLVLDGHLAWLLEPESSSDKQSTSADRVNDPDPPIADGSKRSLLQAQHIEEMSSLAGSLREQLPVPLPQLRFGEKSVSKREFLASLPTGPGNQWYWGWEATSPILAVEMDESFPQVIKHLTGLPLLDSLDDIRFDLKEFLGARYDVADAIRDMSERVTGKPVQNDGRVNGGSITQLFYITVFERAAIQAASGQEQFNATKYAYDRKQSAYAPSPTPLSIRYNFLVRFYDEPIVWLEGQRFGRKYDWSPPERHQELIEYWAHDPQVAHIIASYRSLSGSVERLQQNLAPAFVRKALMNSSCLACPDDLKAP